MQRFIFFISLSLLFPMMVSAQGTWIWNNRTHPELKWKTLKTEHFYVHYHQGLRAVAEKSAQIAEQTYPTIMAQLDLEDFGKTHMTLTSEDEIMNGYAMPSDQIFIWVSQNDVAGQFGGSEKWLRLVVAHEFQHVAMMNALRTWLGIWNGIAIPSWFLEGTAEYYTENWRVGRSDARMKIHTYKNNMSKLDAHDDGYAKILYLADKYGDSTITKIAKWRHKTFKYFNFKKAFRAATGVSIKTFNEDWHRAMNTYYYSYRGQKEPMDKVGDVPAAPKIRYTNTLSIAPDSSKIAIVGRRTGKMQYQSVYTVTTDSTKQVQELHSGRFGSKAAWMPDGSALILGEYRRGDHGSLIYDIRKIDTESGEAHWLTSNLRANHPTVSAAGTVYFIAHPKTATNLYTVDADGNHLRQLTDFTGDVQLNYPVVSPDDTRIAFMIQDESGDVDIAVIDSSGAKFRKLMNDPAEDLMPVWTADGSHIVFTSFRNSTPNLYRVAVNSDSTITQMTDVYSGIYSQQIVPNSSRVYASTLSDVDTTRGVFVDANRTIQNNELVLRDKFEDWRTHAPDSTLKPINYDKNIPSTWETSSYKFWKHPRHIASLGLPTETGLAGFTVWSDGLGKHLAILGGEIAYPPYTHSRFLNGLYFVYNLAVFRPMLSFGLLRNSSFMIQPYDRAWLTERRDGGFLMAEYPVNFGNSLFSNHTIAAQVQMYNRTAEVAGDPRGLRPLVESGREGVFSLRYQWKNQKPDKRNSLLPTQGYGIALRQDFASENIFGKFTYQKSTIDGFVNRKLFGPLTLYGRMLYAQLNGNYASQDSLGFYDDVSLYLMGNAAIGSARGNVINTHENYNLRGSSTIVTGDRLFMSTFEFRMPVLPALPVNIFGIRLGKSVLSPYLDYGKIWNSVEGDTEIFTSGLEMRTAINLGSIPVFHLGFGLGNELSAWEQDHSPHYFVRVALVNPF
ncbi:MAG: Protein TolB [Candidatus Marinimicrobia bacterium]|nr:Protein TolB [Candidatus Neomarinimicrobiota bacterium]